MRFVLHIGFAALVGCTVSRFTSSEASYSAQKKTLCDEIKSEFDLENLKALIEERKFSDFDKFQAAVAPKMSLVAPAYKSFSRQAKHVSYKNPRQIYTTNGTLLLAFEGSARKGEYVEGMSYQCAQNRFEFFEIQKPSGCSTLQFTNEQEIVEGRPLRQVCLDCHHEGPIWEDYPLWPNFFGSAAASYLAYFTATSETQAWQDFLLFTDTPEGQAQKKRIPNIPPFSSVTSEVLSDPVVAQDFVTHKIAGAVNFTLSRNIGQVQALRIAQELADYLQQADNARWSAVIFEALDFKPEFNPQKDSHHDTESPERSAAFVQEICAAQKPAQFEKCDNPADMLKEYEQYVQNTITEKQTLLDERIARIYVGREDLPANLSPIEAGRALQDLIDLSHRDHSGAGEIAKFIFIYHKLLGQPVQHWITMPKNLAARFSNAFQFETGNMHVLYSAKEYLHRLLEKEPD